MSLAKLYWTRYAAEAKQNRLHAEKLSRILERWMDTEEEPALCVLSSGERSALLLAARREHELDSPLISFLNLDPHLQKFVLEARGMACQVGWKLGEIPPLE